MSGLKWTLIAKIVVQSFSWISTLIVIQILTPSDFGIVAIAALAFELLTLIAISGFTSALIKSQSTDKNTASQIFSISLLLHLLFSALLIASASSIATFYNNDSIEHVIYFMALIAPINSLHIVPNAKFSIDMNFKAKALCDSVAALITTVVSLSLAFAGFAYWSLVIANAVGLVTAAIILNIAAKTRYGLTAQLRNMGELLGFAWKVQLSGIIWFAYNRIDVLIVGKTLGTDRLGIYQVASEIASMPLSKLSAIINQVGFAAFASLDDKAEDNYKYLVKTLNYSALIMFPVFLGIASVAHEICHLILGDNWLDAEPIITLLALIFPMRVLSTSINNYLNGINKAGFALSNILLIASVLIVAISSGVQYGLTGAALGWIIGFSIAFNIILLRLKIALGYPLRQLYAWVIYALPAVLMLASIHVSTIYLQPMELSLITMMLMKVAFGVAFISLSYLIFFKNEILFILNKENP